MGIVVAGTSQDCGCDALRYCRLAIGFEAYMLNDEDDEYVNMHAWPRAGPATQAVSNEH